MENKMKSYEFLEVVRWENIPGEYGVSEPWYFPFFRTYWFGQSEYIWINVSSKLHHDSNFFENDPIGRRAGIKINNLRKVYSNKRVAVDGLTLNMFDDDITPKHRIANQRFKSLQCISYGKVCNFAKCDTVFWRNTAKMCFPAIMEQVCSDLNFSFGLQLTPCVMCIMWKTTKMSMLSWMFPLTSGSDQRKRYSTRYKWKTFEAKVVCNLCITSIRMIRMIPDALVFL